MLTAMKIRHAKILNTVLVNVMVNLILINVRHVHRLATVLLRKRAVLVRILNAANATMVSTSNMALKMHVHYVRRYQIASQQKHVVQVPTRNVEHASKGSI